MTCLEEGKACISLPDQLSIRVRRKLCEIAPGATIGGNCSSIWANPTKLTIRVSGLHSAVVRGAGSEGTTIHAGPLKGFKHCAWLHLRKAWCRFSLQPGPARGVIRVSREEMQQTWVTVSLAFQYYK
jgi:hypothetical protein